MNGGWREELAAELPGFVNWALAMPGAEARQTLARDVKSLARAEQDLAALLMTDPLAQWAEDTLIWSDSHRDHLRVGQADSEPSRLNPYDLFRQKQKHFCRKIGVPLVR